MRKILPLLALLWLISCRKSESLPPSFFACSLSFPDSSAAHPRHQQYQALLNALTSSGVAGISMAVHHPSTGRWTGASGKADLFNDSDFQPCNRTRMGSTVKTFTAVAVIQLREQGKLSLDDKVADYLGDSVLKGIENADRATIRQLLQHSSGIYNYIQNLRFQTASLNDLIREWQPEDLLQYARHQPAYFEPGTDVRYSNTNYILLGLLIEGMTQKPLYQVFDENIFLPLGMMQSSFAGKNPVPEGIARGYVDLYSNLQVTESTWFSGWDYHTADGGLISTPYDMSLFLEALFQGRLLPPAAVEEMLTWKEPQEKDPDFFPLAYGLGIFTMETPWGSAYFHSGDAIGYYANMLYFPADSTTLVYAVNSNYGKIDALVSTRAAMEHLFSVVK